MSAAEWANTLASGIVVVSALVFVVVYHLAAPWRSTTMGRHLMAFGATIGALCAYTVVIALVGQDGPAAATLRILRTVILLLIAALLGQRTAMVLRAQRHLKSKDDDQ